MFELIVVLIMLIGAALIGAVLIQPGKGDLSAGFGGVGGQLGSMFGMRKTTDLLTKITIGLAAAVLVLSLIVNKFFLPENENTSVAPAMQGAQAPPAAAQQAPPVKPAPKQNGQQAQPNQK